ncbi:DUF1350 family protein [Prochlorothrix hollandica]|uniref:DUF1350 domain-containing protein n=1 Tax=Prochlorothrix hollandica PCC 9006 = CALU 1027 TaxID=317619 RepID=A0A0M2PZC2_PROHO|nr:DUF1350 family protein [Prochlorothrix hollandica]KKJ01500.1 hypothetical protein PROH_04085 [Prochlorothrix hollandica PCC 9006 = CALU 1027]
MVVKLPLLRLDHRGNAVLIPPHPHGLIHFLGGAFLGMAPQVVYQRLLEYLAQQGYAIIATPFVNTFDHADIARSLGQRFHRTRLYLEQQGKFDRDLPIFGLGHSMGCKLLVLLESLDPGRHQGNIFLAFNNYPARRSIPFLDQVLTQVSPELDMTVEFSPSPEATLDLAQQHYATPHSLLIQFQRDDLDESRAIGAILQQRFPQTFRFRVLSGNHLTPLGQSLDWEPGSSFSPLDAVGQWFRQEVYQDLDQLQGELNQWLQQF